MTGFVTQVNSSPGGVPKLPVARARVTADGLEGDWQKNRKYHGGPERALCLYSRELIDQLVLEGHPIFPGAVGENVTISGIDWTSMRPGARVQIGNVEGVITAFAVPCKTIRGAFADRNSSRISEKLYPGWSRVYLRVECEGEIAPGDRVAIATA